MKSKILTGLFLFSIPPMVMSPYLAIFFLPLFIYLLFSYIDDHEHQDFDSDIVSKVRIVILITPVFVLDIFALFSISDNTNAAIKALYVIILAGIICVYQVSNYVERMKHVKYMFKWIAGKSTDHYIDLCYKICTSVVEEVFFRVMLFFILEGNIALFLLVSVVSSTVYDMFSSRIELTKTDIYKCVTLNTLYAAAMAVTGWPLASVGLRCLNSVGEISPYLAVNMHHSLSKLKKNSSICIN